jgi:hypothetical protein
VYNTFIYLLLTALLYIHIGKLVSELSYFLLSLAYKNEILGVILCTLYPGGELFIGVGGKVCNPELYLGVYT